LAPGVSCSGPNTALVALKRPKIAAFSAPQSNLGRKQNSVNCIASATWVNVPSTAHPQRFSLGL
jgi:hypothetical protein